MMKWLALSILALTLACKSSVRDVEVKLPSGKSVTLSSQDTLRGMVMSEPPTLDWHKASDHVSVVTDNFMEGLIRYVYGGRGLAVVPALATRWEPIEGGRSWRFVLREGVVWSDGRPFEARHVLDGIKRLLSRETASPYAQYLYVLRNAKNFNEGSVDFSRVGVRAVSPHEVVFDLNEARVDFPFLLTHPSTFPVRLDVIEQHGSTWTEPGKIVTLGPYVLRAWNHGSLLWLERNENYYGRATGQFPGIRNIAIRVMADEAAAVAAFREGALDSVHQLSSRESAVFRGSAEFRETGTLSIYYYGFNVTRAPANNVWVRRAIASAIDRAEVVRALGSEQLVLRSWVPPGVNGYTSSIGLVFNVARARSFLDRSGVRAGVPLVLRFNMSEDNRRVAENIRDQLARNLGLTVVLESAEWKPYLESLRASEAPHLFRLSWNADVPDPLNFFSVLTGSSGTNRTGWRSAAYDSAVARASRSLDIGAREEAMLQAQKILLEDEIPVIPLFTAVHHLLVSPRVDGYPVNPQLRYPYLGARLR